MEEPEKPGRTLGTATSREPVGTATARARRRRIEGPAELVQAEVGEPVPIGPGTSTYRRRRRASRVGYRLRETPRRVGSDAERPPAEHRGKVEACMPS